RTKFLSDVFDPCFSEPRLDAAPNRFGGARNCECRQTRLRIFRSFYFDRTQTLCNRFCDFLCVSRCPNSRAVDAATTAVEKHAVADYIDVLFPLVDDVIAYQNLGEARAVNLNSDIAPISLDGRRSSEDHRPV